MGVQGLIQWLMVVPGTLVLSRLLDILFIHLLMSSNMDVVLGIESRHENVQRKMYFMWFSIRIKEKLSTYLHG
jgi:hypothetical protein